MKKNILKYICITLIAPAFFACDSFLDEAPYSEITNENWGGGDKDKATTIEKAEEIENLISGAYTNFASEFWQLDWFIINDAQADNAYAGENKIQTLEIDELRLSTTNGNVQREWKYLYEHISKTNTIIHWVGQIKDPALTEKRRKEIEGEARFMRALAYFNLVRIYGNVPVITDYLPEITNDNINQYYDLIYPARKPVEEVYTQILEDLDYAQKNVIDYSSNKFQITKAFVNLILAQVHATKDGFENTDWQKVKEYLKSIESDGRYALLDNYNDLFEVTISGTQSEGILPDGKLKNEHSKESIFELECVDNTATGNWSASMFYGTDWKKFNTPSKDLVRAFESEGDVIRKEASIKYGDVTGKWTDKFWPSNRYPYCFKQRVKSNGNIIFFRYAEVILLLAEAENELGNISEAKALLNKIRNRAELEDTKANTKDALRLAIENEYRLEFAFEGKRWMDLKRRGRFIEVMHRTVDHQNAYAAGMNENKLLWPIPQSEMDLNENLTQNRGY